MSKRATTLGALSALLLSATALPTTVNASSHREAPLIAEDPAADNTDLWAFVSPDDANSVTFVAGYVPLQEPGGGPNFHRFSDQVLYELHIDNNGDARPDITYQFRFRTTYNPALTQGAAGTFFYNVGQIDGLPTPGAFHNASLAQTVTVTRVEGGTTTPVIADAPTAPTYVGRFAYGTGGMPAADDANYARIAQMAVRTAPSGESLFAGPRDDPFFADLGAVFDDVTIRGPAGALGSRGGGVDYVGGYNVSIIAIKVPITRLVRSGTPSDPMNAGNVIGVYASASRPRITIRRSQGLAVNERNLDTAQGQFVQVSRLGIPLVNEVLIPLADKDRFNRTNPVDDAANFGGNILIPSLPTYAQALYGPMGIRARLGYTAPLRSATDPMNDMLLLVTGRVGTAGTPAAGFAPADMLRLNVRTAPSPLPTNTGNPTLGTGLSRLGAAGGDTRGFPNGRRLFDDVVDIEERYVLNGLANLNAIPFGDGVDGNDVPYQTAFPYVPAPRPGSETPATNPHRTEPAR